jgi:hypothetical protein
MGVAFYTLIWFSNRDLGRRLVSGRWVRLRHLSRLPELGYPLIPVMEMPSMKVFWVKKKSTMMGRATSVLAAIR